MLLVRRLISFSQGVSEQIEIQDDSLQRKDMVLSMLKASAALRILSGDTFHFRCGQILFKRRHSTLVSDVVIMGGNHTHFMPTDNTTRVVRSTEYNSIWRTR